MPPPRLFLPPQADSPSTARQEPFTERVFWNWPHPYHGSAAERRASRRQSQVTVHRRCHGYGLSCIGQDDREPAGAVRCKRPGDRLLTLARPVRTTLGCSSRVGGHTADRRSQPLGYRDAARSRTSGWEAGRSWTPGARGAPALEQPGQGHGHTDRSAPSRRP
jgi:hypothetical protein